MVILETVVPVFLMIALGKLLTVRGLLNEKGVSCIKNICVSVFLPVLAFDALIHGTYSSDSFILIGCELFLLFGAFFAGFWIRKFFPADIKPYLPYAMGTYEGGLFGWTLIGILVGAENLYYIVSMDIFNGVFGFTVMAVGYKLINGEKLSGEKVFRSIITNPLIISVALGFLGAAFHLGEIIDGSKFCGLYTSIVQMLTKPLAGMILLCIGSGIVFDKEVLLRGFKVSVVRYLIQFVLGCAVFAVIYFTIGFNKPLLITLLMYLACPASFLLSIYAQKKEGVEFASAVISFQIIAAMIVFAVLSFYSLSAVSY